MLTNLTSAKKKFIVIPTISEKKWNINGKKMNGRNVKISSYSTIVQQNDKLFISLINVLKHLEQRTTYNEQQTYVRYIQSQLTRKWIFSHFGIDLTNKITIIYHCGTAHMWWMDRPDKENEKRARNGKADVN